MKLWRQDLGMKLIIRRWNWDPTLVILQTIDPLGNPEAWWHRSFAPDVYLLRWTWGAWLREFPWIPIGGGPESEEAFCLLTRSLSKQGRLEISYIRKSLHHQSESEQSSYGGGTHHPQQSVLTEGKSKMSFTGNSRVDRSDGEPWRAVNDEIMASYGIHRRS